MVERREVRRETRLREGNADRRRGDGRDAIIGVAPWLGRGLESGFTCRLAPVVGCRAARFPAGGGPVRAVCGGNAGKRCGVVLVPWIARRGYLAAHSFAFAPISGPPTCNQFL